MSKPMQIIVAVFGALMLAAVVLTMFGKPPNLPLGPLQGMLAGDDPAVTATGTGAITDPAATTPCPTSGAAGATATTPAAAGTAATPSSGAAVTTPSPTADLGSAEAPLVRVADVQPAGAAATTPVDPAAAAAGTSTAPAAGAASAAGAGSTTDCADGTSTTPGSTTTPGTSSTPGSTTPTTPTTPSTSTTPGAGSRTTGARTSDGTNSGNSPEGLRAAADAAGVMQQAKITVSATTTLLPAAGGAATAAPALKAYRARVTAAVLVIQLRDPAALQQWTSAGRVVQIQLVKGFLGRLARSYTGASRSVSVVDPSGGLLAVGDAARGGVAKVTIS